MITFKQTKQITFKSFHPYSYLVRTGKLTLGEILISHKGTAIFTPCIGGLRISELNAITRKMTSIHKDFKLATFLKRDLRSLKRIKTSS